MNAKKIGSYIGLIIGIIIDVMVVLFVLGTYNPAKWFRICSAIVYGILAFYATVRAIKERVIKK